MPRRRRGSQRAGAGRSRASSPCSVGVCSSGAPRFSSRSRGTSFDNRLPLTTVLPFLGHHRRRLLTAAEVAGLALEDSPEFPAPALESSDDGSEFEIEGMFHSEEEPEEAAEVRPGPLLPAAPSDQPPNAPPCHPWPGPAPTTITLTTPSTITISTPSAIEPPLQVAKRGRRLSSFVWNHFLRQDSNRFVVQCTHCQVLVRVGKEGGCQKVGTTAMRRHLAQYHKDIVPLPKKKRVEDVPLTPFSVASSSRSTSPAQGITTQLALQQSLGRERVWKPSDPRAMEKNQLLALCIAEGLLPCSIVEKPWMKELLHGLCPQWKVPGRTFFANSALPALGQSIMAQIKESLAACVGSRVHLTMSIYSTGQVEDYMSVSGHWLSVADGGLLQRHRAVLDVSGLGCPHTALNISAKLDSVLGTWFPALSLRHGFVAADNTANLQRALKDRAMTHVPCMVRCLDTVVKAFVAKLGGEVEAALKVARAICAHFGHSVAACAALREVQVQQGMPQHCLLRDVPARWTSSLVMVRRLVEQQQAVTLFFKDSTEFRLAPAQWSLLKDLVTALEPFEDVTEALSMDDATLSQALPSAAFLERYSQFLSSEGAPMQRRLLDDLVAQLKADGQLEAMKGDVTFCAASYLDPRFRDTFANYVGGKVEEKLHRVQELLLLEIAGAYRQRQKRNGKERGRPEGVAASLGAASSFQGSVKEEAATPSAAGSASDVESCKRSNVWFSNASLMTGIVTGSSLHGYRSPIEEGVAVARRELDAYAADDVSAFAAVNSNPVLYWQDKRHVWPSLYSVAVSYLACPPTSVDSERLFSGAGKAIALGGRRPSSINLDLLSFIRTNRSWIPKDVTRSFEATLGASAEADQDVQHGQEEEEEDKQFLQLVVFDSEDDE